MIKESLNKRLIVTAEGILIPNSLWISGKYYILQNADEEGNEESYLKVQFFRNDHPVMCKGYYGTAAVTLEHKVGLKEGEYILHPDSETEAAIKKEAFCIVDTSIEVTETRQLKDKYLFRLYRRLISASTRVLSIHYPDIEQLEGIKLSEILALRGISKNGVEFLRLIFDDMGISFEDDVFPKNDLKRVKADTSDRWILI